MDLFSYVISRERHGAHKRGGAQYTEINHSRIIFCMQFYVYLSFLLLLIYLSVCFIIEPSSSLTQGQFFQHNACIYSMNMCYMN